MRVNEYKLRQKEASYHQLTDSEKKTALKLLLEGYSKKAIRLVLGCSYESLKISALKG
ncbi:hypothetical protein P3551_23000 [Vibrio parahaemolyticus]|uniref:hypothetical protein n=1 Tax=Vibrio parahaemolyticus TaxID=670 RepID=UPI0015DDFFEF|nr:hypothetical protein [Vibrio parahaemolyticus]MBE3985595.1 hypothetical protein [Vibrio parahaemolyticus]MBE4286494.1 hypothetical protein [Vibrio parahaemolyticus]MDF4902154.1 hypothetical protein [Vibrio parahaemolyticus]HCG7330537.1 hypothetical protein [Vibrio parahaemolyticus]HCG8859875.1 hypothetical protein [Vibrio parahaemolyticus]